MNILLLNLIVTISINQNLQYFKTPLSDMIENSGLIIQVEIIKIHDKEIEVNVIETIKGNEYKKLKIRKFQDWPCASRWSKYKVGQKSIMFLEKFDQRKYFQTMGGGNEGELPIENNKIYYKTRGNTHELNSGKFYGKKYKLKYVKRGIKTYLENTEMIDAMVDDKSILNFFPKNSFYLEAIEDKIGKNIKLFTRKEIENRSMIRKRKN